MTTSTNFTICDNTIINATQAPSGIITSINYPQWQANQRCNRTLIVQDKRIIKVYITDISVEPPNLSNNEYEF